MSEYFFSELASYFMLDIIVFLLFLLFPRIVGGANQ